MNNFLVPIIPADNLFSSGLRVRMVDGNGMAPDLLSQRDYVMIAPIDKYCGEGVYFVDWGFGGTLYRADGSGRRETPIRMRLDNPLYQRTAQHGFHYFTIEQFNDMVLGFVVANIKVTNEAMLRLAVDNGGK